MAIVARKKDTPPERGKPGRKPPPEGETARDRFVRLAEYRASRAMDEIRKIGNLATPRYAWMPEDLPKLHDALLEAIDQTFQRFENQKKTEPRPFKLVDGGKD